jgi:hypothetical protein
MKINSNSFKRLVSFYFYLNMNIIACPSNKYGDNCSETCECRNALSCDPISGCKCIAGYTGSSCETVIDECLSKKYIKISMIILEVIH